MVLSTQKKAYLCWRQGYVMVSLSVYRPALIPVRCVLMAFPVLSSTSTIEYPSADGQPMAESDFQRKPLTYGVEALDIYFQDRPDVYVSGNLFIYYEEGNPQASIAPDVFVVFGAPKRDRASYLLWSEP